jgi:outer membrane murein-binding lipoprotein Lpp
MADPLDCNIESKKLVELLALTETPNNNDMMYILHYDQDEEEFVDRSVTVGVLLSGVNQRIDDLTARVDTLDSRITVNTQNIANNRAQIIANTDAINVNAQKIAQNCANIETLFGEIQRIDGELDAIRADILAIWAEIAEIKLDLVKGRRPIPATLVVDWRLGDSWYASYGAGTYNLTFVGQRQAQEIHLELDLSGGAIINLPASVTRVFGKQVADTFNVVALKAVEAETQQHAVWVQECP